MKEAQVLSLSSPVIHRRPLAPAMHGEEVAQSPLPAVWLADEDAAYAAADMPRWARPLYQQLDRPSRAAIAAYQRTMAAERALSVPHGINIYQQAGLAASVAEESQQAVPDMVHCDACEAPYEAYECECPYCHYGR